MCLSQQGKFIIKGFARRIATLRPFWICGSIIKIGYFPIKHGHLGIKRRWAAETRKKTNQFLYPRWLTRVWHHLLNQRASVAACWVRLSLYTTRISSTQKALILYWICSCSPRVWEIVHRMGSYPWFFMRDLLSAGFVEVVQSFWLLRPQIMNVGCWPVASFRVYCPQPCRSEEDGVTNLDANFPGNSWIYSWLVSVVYQLW